MTTMRALMTLAETALSEVDRTGSIPDDNFYDSLNQRRFDNDQLDLFREVPTLEPDLPEEFRMAGRIGEMFVAERTDGDARVFVVFDKGAAAAYISLVPWSRARLNYPSDDHFEPDLEGSGLRVNGVMVDKAYRGQGLGPKLYQWVLEHVCDYIIADEGHTPDGEALWKRMAGMKSVFAVEVWDGVRYKSRERRRGKDWDQIYNTNSLIPWMTLRSKREQVLGSED